MEHVMLSGLIFGESWSSLEDHQVARYAYVTNQDYAF